MVLDESLPSLELSCVSAIETLAAEENEKTLTCKY